jgi:hypothetical protein
MSAMNWLEGYVALSNDVVALGVNLGLQTTLVIGGGLFAEWLCRRRGAAVQSSILRVTLVAALLCPGASWLLNAAGVPGFRVSVPPGQMVAVEVPKSDTASEDQRPAPSYDRPPDTLRVPFELLQDLPNAAPVDERFRSGQVSHPLSASQVTEVSHSSSGRTLPGHQSRSS